jgi:hypothetical protein
MAHRALPAAVAGLGLFLALGAALALIAGAPVPASVFGALATVHLVVAAGLARGSVAAATVGGLLGLLELALVGFGVWFIAGIQLGLGRVDFGAQWFAPLNGYATVVVAAVITLVDFALVRRAIHVIRGTAAVAVAI